MENAFSWIGQIFNALLDFIPRFKVIPTTHSGVAFIRGKKVKEIKPGFIFWWPFWTEMIIYPIVRQTINLPQQTLRTADENTIQINTVVVYSVEDIVKALTKQWDLEETIRDLCLSLTKYTISKYTFEEIEQNSRKIDIELTKNAIKELSEFGVKIHKVCLTDLSVTFVVTISKFGEHSIYTEG